MYIYIYVLVRFLSFLVNPLLPRSARSADISAFLALAICFEPPLRNAVYESTSKNRGNPGQELNHSRARLIGVFHEQWHTAQCRSSAIVHHGNGKTFKAPAPPEHKVLLCSLHLCTCGNRAGITSRVSRYTSAVPRYYP